MPPAACHRGDVSASRRPTARTSTTVSIPRRPLTFDRCLHERDLPSRIRGSRVGLEGNVPVPITLWETTVCIPSGPLTADDGTGLGGGQTVSSTLIARRSSIAR